MKEEKDIQPVDKLFRQALEGYKPAPPPSVWKQIRSGLSNSGSPFIQFLNKYSGLLIGSAVIIGIIIFLVYNDISTPVTKNTNKLKPLIKVEQSTSDNNSHQTSTKSDNSIIVDTCKITTPSIVNSNLHKATESATKTDNQDIAAKLPVQKHLVSTIKSSENTTETPKTVAAKTGNVSLRQNEIISPSNASYTKPETDNYQEIDKSIVPNKLEVTDSTNINIPSNSSLVSEKNENVPASVSSEENAPVKPTWNYKYYVGAYGTFGQVLIKGLSSNNFYSGGIIAGISNSKLKMSLETGIGFSYYKNYGNYNFEFQRSDTIGYTGYTLFNSYDSSYLIIYRPTIKDTLLYKNAIPQTSYSYLRIPLYLTKQIFHFGKIDIGIKTGPSCEFLVKKNENQPEYQLPGTKFIALTNNSFTMLSVNWQWLIAPQISVGITKKINFRLEPAANFYLNNLYDKKNRPSAKPFGISVTAGLTYQFE
jgi:hypothetical protein